MSGEIVVGDAGLIHEAKLAPGRNVRGTVVKPDGTKLGLTLCAHLFRNGVEFMDTRGNEWQGVGFGKYTARIRSTRDWEEEAKKEGIGPDKIPPEDRVGRREVSFVIDASTPATLDLGEIHVPRESVP
jgi:hypothetical protein